MPELKALVDAYKSKHGSSYASVSDRMGLEEGALWSWFNRGLSQMPSPYLLHSLAREIHTSYTDVLDAALRDFDYRPESRAENAAPPAKVKRGKGRKIN
jgi:hypothetical protein